MGTGKSLKRAKKNRAKISQERDEELTWHVETSSKVYVYKVTLTNNDARLILR